jgi:hypothetical protein
MEKSSWSVGMQAAPHEMFPPDDAAPGVASGQHLQPAALFYIDLIWNRSCTLHSED